MSWGRTWKLGELDRNRMGTRWEQKEKTKKSHPTPSPKRKKSTPCECMLTFLIGCMKLVFGKLSAEVEWRER
jgi:hypothetical protein